MPQSVENAIKSWAAPVLLAALLGVCGVLWSDMRGTISKLSDNVGSLQIAVTRLTVIQEQQAKRAE